MRLRGNRTTSGFVGFIAYHSSSIVCSRTLQSFRNTFAEKMRDIPTDFYRTRAMTSSAWKEPLQDLRHVITRLDARPVGEATSSDHQKAARRHGPLHRLLTKADALEVTDSAKITMEPAEEDSWELVEVDSEPLPNYYNSGVDRSQEDPSYQLLLKANEPKVTVTMTFMDRAELPDSSADSPAMLPASVTITIEPPEEEFEAFIVTSDSPSYNYKSSVEVSEESLHHFRRPRYCHHSVYPEQEDDVYYTKPRYC